MGQQQGRPLKRLGFTLPPPEEKMLRFARQCEGILDQHTPELLDEIRGLAQAAELDYAALLTLTLTAPFDSDALPNCSIVAVMPEQTAEGRLIIGRNYDMFYDVSKEGATTYRTYPQGGYASLGNCDIWVGREDGLNESGLFIGMTGIHLPGLKPGLAFWFIVRRALDHCATVDEAVELIQNTPHAQSAGYLLADDSGKAVVVEATVDGVELRGPEDGLLILTNHAVCPALAGKDRDSTCLPDSHSRYNRLRELLEGSKAMDVKAVKQALSDHQGGVCSHGVEAGRKHGTIWSLVGHPGERGLEIAEGHPCRAKYRPTSF
jgi:hypothetical protein